MSTRPELKAPPEIYYDDAIAKKYTTNTRNQQIQAQMTDRALELLNLSRGKPALLLDIGCGSGLSGEILEEEGHIWVGMDISPSMLQVALEREVEGDLFLQDIGQGLGFRPGSFDGAISISVLQWLCNAETSSPTMSPPFRLRRFFTSLHASLCGGSRAVFQFYPQSDDQVELIMSIAMKCGFRGGLVVDYPNSKKAKKFFLCLFTGGTNSNAHVELPKGLTGEEGPGYEDATHKEVIFEKQRARTKERGKRKGPKETAKEWILRKKELYRRRGKEGVPTNSKFTGRKRGPKF
ncbi:williams-Beuren syndrome critical region protein 22 [Cantharellus anzutake]|uniref:williams-Beuren syndrome critical region protein 22 n=1 Tax=Cantharellus anzutake TaxID=1750568 RepID=UPI0019043557|nr:williams-Beuren syndrome critical region protein 22 [Cantharellus anzutake]KAF8337526.1 williams-Beuren syndrome critical region protein 22 [Cantharellus anzutake]